MRASLRLLLALVPLCALAFTPATAQWSDNFDGYALGSGLHGQGGWVGWDDDPAWDAFVTDVQALSAPHSVAIAGASDIVQRFSGYTSGRWIFTAWQYVPSNYSGISYVLLLNVYNPFGPYNWSSQVSFNGGTNMVVSDPEGDSLPLIRGQWVELRVEIDLDLDLQTFYYNDQMLYSKSWTEGVSGGGSLMIQALDLFANNASPIYYDNISLEQPGPTAIETTTWGRIKQSYR